MTAIRCGSSPRGWGGLYTVRGQGRLVHTQGAEDVVRSLRDGGGGLAGSTCLGHAGLSLLPGVSREVLPFPWPVC